MIRYSNNIDLNFPIIDTFTWSTLFGEEPPKDIVEAPTVHEQDDGTILAMCITGTGSKDSLKSWIRFLQISNPKLGEIPVVFKLVTCLLYTSPSPRD